MILLKIKEFEGRPGPIDNKPFHRLVTGGKINKQEKQSRLYCQEVLFTILILGILSNT